MTTTRTIRHACGHYQEHKFGPDSGDVARRAVSLSRRDCRHCFMARVRKHDAAAVAFVKAQRPDLPDLIGTEKQIEWAETIRADALPYLESYLMDDLRGRMESFARKEEDEQILLYPLMEKMYRELAGATDDMQRERRAVWWIEEGSPELGGVCREQAERFTRIARAFRAQAEDLKLTPTLDI